MTNMTIHSTTSIAASDLADQLAATTSKAGPSTTERSSTSASQPRIDSRSREPSSHLGDAGADLTESVRRRLQAATLSVDGPSSTSSSGTLTPSQFQPFSLTVDPAFDTGYLRSNSGARSSVSTPGLGLYGIQPDLGTLPIQASGPLDMYTSSDAKLRALQLEMHLNELAARQASILVQAERDTLLREQHESMMQRRFNAAPSYGDATNVRAMTNIYINNLPESTTDEALFRLGSVCGTVISHKAMIDLDKGTCKGYGFVMYSTPEEAQRAIIWFSSNGFQTSYAKESFSAKLRRMADKTSTNVYLSNLPVKFTVQQLEQLFAPHPVVSLRILTDANGESRGVGFVRLKDREVAQECIDRLANKILPGTTQPLQVRFADSEAQKQLKQSVSTKRTIESLGLNKVNGFNSLNGFNLRGLQHSALFPERSHSQPSFSGGGGGVYGGYPAAGYGAASSAGGACLTLAASTTPDLSATSMSTSSSLSSLGASNGLLAPPPSTQWNGQTLLPLPQIHSHHAMPVSPTLFPTDLRGPRAYDDLVTAGHGAGKPLPALHLALNAAAAKASHAIPIRAPTDEANGSANSGTTGSSSNSSSGGSSSSSSSKSNGKTTDALNPPTKEGNPAATGVGVAN